MRNHEYYYDPTAGKAIKMIEKERKKHTGPLTYPIGRVKSFRDCRKIIKARLKALQ